MLRFVRHHVPASLVAALALGLGGRVVMRLIAWASGMPGGYSIGGSLEVILFGTLIGLPVALAFFAVRPRLRSTLPWPGILTGAAVFLALALVPPPAAQSAMAGTPDPPLVTALLFLGLFLAFGAGLEWRWGRWTRERAR